MNTAKIQLLIFSAASLAMHLYPFWMVRVFDLVNPIGFWKDSIVEIVLNLLCAILVFTLNSGAIQRFMGLQMALLITINVANIAIGFQIYALFGFIVDIWSISFVILLRRKSKEQVASVRG